MDRNALTQLLAHETVATAATTLRVNRRTIYRWCKRHRIPRRVYRCPDCQLLRRMESCGVLQKQIARYFGVSRWTIRNWCHRYGILHHTTGQFRRGTNRNTPEIHEEMPFGIGIAFSDEID